VLRIVEMPGFDEAAADLERNPLGGTRGGDHGRFGRLAHGHRAMQFAGQPRDDRGSPPGFAATPGTASLILAVDQ
jgi:hypothetical protein